MTEPSRFAHYRVRLIRVEEPVIGTLPRLLWRKPVFRKGDTGYRGEALSKRYGERWPHALAQVAADKSLEIFGSNDERSWYSLSTWRRSSPSEAATPVANIDRRELIRARMRNAIAQLDKEPSRAVAAWHLKRQGLTREHIIKTMNELGWDDVSRQTIGDHLKYGKQLETDGIECPFDVFA